MKKIFACLFVATTLLLAVPIPASAQVGGLKQLIPGGTYRLPLLTTNNVALGLTSTNVYGLQGTPTNLVQSCGDYDYLGITWQFVGATNATLLAYRTYDNGAVYEATPGFQCAFVGTSANTAGLNTNGVFDVHGATHVAFVLKNASNIDATNNLLEVNLKAPKIQAVPGTR